MSRQKHYGDSSLVNNHFSKDGQKRESSSIEQAHILSVLSKCKVLSQTGGFSQKIESCLLELDKAEETSLVLQALKFSDHVTICLDPNASDLFRIAKSRSLAWFDYQEGELLIGAAELITDRKYFMGVFVHELTHWCMQVVFKNECLPYHQSDLNRVRQEEFDAIVQNVKDLISNYNLDSVITSVFRDYSETNWHQELIVRVPHLIAQNGVHEATNILRRHQPTSELFEFYKEYVLGELRKFIAGGDLEKSRESVVKLNRKLGLLQLYRNYEFQFKTRVDIDFQDGTSLWVIGSPHPYLSFFKIARTLNYDETIEVFDGNNVFCDVEAFVEYYTEILSTFRKLEECKTLFIVCPQNEDETSFKNLFVCFEKVLQMASNKKVILAVRSKMLSLAKKQLGDIPSFNSKCVSMKKIEFGDLMCVSQKYVLNSSIIFHQENEVELNDVLEEEEYNICNGIMIERLIDLRRSKRKMTIGGGRMSDRDCLVEFVPFYEKLKIQRLMELIRDCSDVKHQSREYALILVGDLDTYPEVLSDCLCEVFECEDLNETSVKSPDDRISQKQLAHHVLLIDSEVESKHYNLVSEFQIACCVELCYFVKVSKKLLFSYLMYYPNLAFYRDLGKAVTAESLQTVDVGKTNVITQDIFMERIVSGNERINVLSDSAGTGKTKFLNMIHFSITHCWVITCFLKSCFSFIDEYELGEDVEHDDAADFILRMGRTDDPFAENLLHQKMIRASQFPVLLLLDGIDEITSSDRNSASKNREKIVNLVEFLKNHTHIRVLITTRPEYQSEFSHLSCPIFEFSPVSLEESETYLINLCTARRRLFSKSAVTSVNELVKKYIGGYRLDTHVSNDFLKSPLHVSMLSEIIVESMKDGAFRSAVVNSMGNLMPDRLYNEFINNKYKIYFKEKKNIAVDERLKEICNSAFQTLALFSLYGGEGIDTKYFSKNELFRFEKSGKVTLNHEKVTQYFDMGIISSLDGNVEFVHQTFAEYFVSCLFLSWAQDKSMSERWIVDVIYEPHRVMSFLESMLNNISLPDEIIEEHGELMASLNIDKTVLALKMSMWFDRLNTLDYIFKCWKQADKFHIILNPKTYHNGTNYPLFFASTMSSDRILERFLQEEFDVNYKVHDNTYAISALFKRGNVTLLKRFVESGLLNDHVMRNARDSALYEAAASGNIELVEWLESTGYEICQEKTIDSAIANGKLEMAQWLKKRGVGICHRSENFERTAIHVAVERRHFYMVKWLIDEGLDINASDRLGLTPLHVAIRFGLLDMVRFLVENGANILVCSENGKNALQFAASNTLPRIDMFKWLVGQGCKIDEKNPTGCSAVHLALMRMPNIQVVEWLLDHAKDMQATDVRGRGYLHYAAANRDEFRFRLLLSRNCNVHLRDDEDKTAAHVALDTMRSLEPWVIDSDDQFEKYNQEMVHPFKLLVLEMAKTNQHVLEELVSYAKGQAETKSSLILEAAIKCMEKQT